MGGLRWLINHLRGKRGAVLVLYGVAMTMMLGFAAISVDAGYVYLRRQSLVNSLDAAALAGVSQLPDNPAAAARVARDILAANGRDPNNASISVSADNLEISVTMDTYTDLFFARVLGIDNARVTGNAAARVEWITAIRGAAPFGVPRQDFQVGMTYILKAGSGGGRNGNFHALALGGNGANTYRNNITYGYSEVLRIGDWITTQPGNMSGPTEQGLNARIGNAPTAVDADGDGYLDLPPNSPRVLLSPIIDFFDARGRSRVQVVGFGAFYVQDWGVSGNGEVRGQFIRYMTQGESGGTGNFGLRTVKLIH